MRAPVRRVGRRAVAGLALVALLGPARASRAAPTWTFHGTVADGGQIDAVRGPSGRVHLISSRYYQLDATGAVVVDEAQGDGRQSALDFPPAIAVGDDGTVHTVTRHGGDFTAGHELRYRRRSAGGAWDVDAVVGSPVTRNYVVGVAWAGPGAVYLATSEGGTDVWGDAHLWDASSGSPVAIGDLSGIWRADADFRLRGRAGMVHMVSGKCDPSGTVYVLRGAPGAGLVGALSGSQQTHTAGAGRRAFPDLYLDPTGALHLTYGAEQQVYYNRYDPQGQAVFGADVLVFDGLGTWHLSTGLSAVAADDSGQIVLAVGLLSDGSQSASNSDLWWSISYDGGATWTAPADLGVNTDGGEGRRRPRLVAIGTRFYLLYRDNSNAGISLAIADVVVDADGDGYDAGEDCDDGNAAVHPGAVELCNGVDDDCDDLIDEGCPTDPDAGVGDDAAVWPDGQAPIADGQVPPDAQPGADGGAGPGGVSGGCGCQGAGAAPGALPLVLALLFGLFRRRRFC